MQIVIDIPEEMVMALKQGSFGAKYNMYDIVGCVMNGTPLSKHGRLIDADKIISEATERMKYPANHEYMECVIAHMKLATTIVEADGGYTE